MIFNSLSFIVFFCIFTNIFYLTRGNARLWFVLVASNIFYGWWEWKFVGLLWLSILFNYYAALLISDHTKTPAARRNMTVAAVAFDLCLLGFFKYCDFFIGNLNAALTAAGIDFSMKLLGIVVPIGISFFTFHVISYVVDVYRRAMPPERSLVKFAVYISLFPHLVAGPIVRAKAFLPQLQQDVSFSTARFARGVELTLWGLFLKVCVADTLAHLVDAVYESPHDYGAGTHFISTLFFSFQIYGDFCGYSLMAIGIGFMLGYDFGINFIRPYLACSFSDFWGRWHISLSSWLRDYLYIPLGGNRVARWKMFRNLTLVMLLAGLWHGANWTFIVWGLLHGFFLILQRIASGLTKGIVRRLPSFPMAVAQAVFVFTGVCLAWIFFRAPNIDTALDILAIIAKGDNGFAGLERHMVTFTKGMALIGMLVAIEIYQEWLKGRVGWIEAAPVRTAFAACLVWIITFMGTFSGAQFIYFQF